jgi:hypothetical protein
MEKNPTIFPFPVQNLDLTNYVFRDDDQKSKSKSKGDSSAPPLAPTETEIRNMSIQQLKAVLRKYNRSDLFKTVVEKF